MRYEEESDEYVDLSVYESDPKALYIKSIKSDNDLSFSNAITRWVAIRCWVFPRMLASGGFLTIGYCFPCCFRKIFVGGQGLDVGGQSCDTGDSHSHTPLGEIPTVTPP